jgi:hypothetical protein
MAKYRVVRVARSGDRGLRYCTIGRKGNRALCSDNSGIKPASTYIAIWQAVYLFCNMPANTTADTLCP